MNAQEIDTVLEQLRKYVSPESYADIETNEKAVEYIENVPESISFMSDMMLMMYLLYSDIGGKDPHTSLKHCMEAFLVTMDDPQALEALKRHIAYNKIQNELKRFSEHWREN